MAISHSSEAGARLEGADERLLIRDFCPERVEKEARLLARWLNELIVKADHMRGSYLHTKRCAVYFLITPSRL